MRGWKSTLDLEIENPCYHFIKIQNIIAKPNIFDHGGQIDKIFVSSLRD